MEPRVFQYQTLPLEYQKKFSMLPKVIAVTSTVTACPKDMEFLSKFQ